MVTKPCDLMTLSIPWHSCEDYLQAICFRGNDMSSHMVLNKRILEKPPIPHTWNLSKLGNFSPDPLPNCLLLFLSHWGRISSSCLITSNLQYGSPSRWAVCRGEEACSGRVEQLGLQSQVLREQGSWWDCFRGNGWVSVEAHLLRNWIPKLT